MSSNGKKAYVAMSGGVDSSVAAALLANRGFDCTGAFFITWTETLPGVSVCPWEQDVFDARQVCNRLGIPLYTFNFEREYKQRVIEYFFRDYQGGCTPNPDIMCNREIKFNLFLKKPIIGYGYNRLRYVRSRSISHAGASFSSSYLTILVSSGIAGLIGLISTMRLIWIRKKNARTLLLFLTTVSLFDNVLLHPFILFISGVLLILSDR